MWSRTIPGVCCHVVWSMVASISKECGASIFTVGVSLPLNITERLLEWAMNEPLEASGERKSIKEEESGKNKSKILQIIIED